jgi:hypothetical protein
LPNPLNRYTLQELLAKKFPPGEVLVEGLIQRGQNVMLVADKKSGKTIFAEQLALSVATGTTFAGLWKVPSPRKVLYLGFEGGEDEHQDLLRRQIGYHQMDVTNADITMVLTPFLPMNSAQFESRFMPLLLEIQPELLIIDPFYRAHQGSLRDEESLQLTTANLTMATMINNHATLILHHVHRKRRDMGGQMIDEGGDAYFGSFVLAAWPDTQLFLEFDADEKAGKLSASFERRPRFGPPKSLTMVDEPDKLAFVAQAAPLSNFACDVLQILGEEQGLGHGEIVRRSDMIKYRTQSARAVKELLKHKLVKIDKGQTGQADAIWLT